MIFAIFVMNLHNSLDEIIPTYRSIVNSAQIKTQFL